MIQNLVIDPPLTTFLPQRYIFTSSLQDDKAPRLLILNNEFAEESFPILKGDKSVISTKDIKADMLFTPFVLKDKQLLIALTKAYAAYATSTNIDINSLALKATLQLIGIASNNSPSSSLQTLKRWHGDNDKKLISELSKLESQIKKDNYLTSFVNAIKTQTVKIIRLILDFLWKMHEPFLKGRINPPIDWLSEKKLIVFSVKTISQANYYSLVCLFSIFSSKVHVYFDYETPVNLINLCYERDTSVEVLTFSSAEPTKNILPFLHIAKNAYMTMQMLDTKLYLSWVSTISAKYIVKSKISTAKLDMILNNLPYGSWIGKYITFDPKATCAKIVFAKAAGGSNVEFISQKINFDEALKEVAKTEARDTVPISAPTAKQAEVKPVKATVDLKPLEDKLDGIGAGNTKNNASLIKLFSELEAKMLEQFEALDKRIENLEQNSSSSAFADTSNPWTNSATPNQINQQYENTLQNGNSIYKRDDPLQHLVNISDDDFGVGKFTKVSDQQNVDDQIKTDSKNMKF